MGIREHEAKTQIDYKLVGKKLLSAEVMEEDQKNLVFEIATKFASDLVNEKTGDLQMSKEVRSHMNVIVLDRVVSLYQSGSTATFEDLKRTICETFSVDEEMLTNERLRTFLSSRLDEYFDKNVSEEVGKNMEFIRTKADKVVPMRINI